MIYYPVEMADILCTCNLEAFRFANITLCVLYINWIRFFSEFVFAVFW